MDQIALVAKQIDDGRKLVEQLAHDGFEVTAACWVRESEEGQWFLYIASPVVDREGAKQAYHRVQRAFLQMPPSFGVDRFEVKLVGAANPLTQDVRKVQGARSNGLPTRYHGSRLGEVPIEEAYIYPVLAVA